MIVTAPHTIELMANMPAASPFDKGGTLEAGEPFLSNTERAEWARQALDTHVGLSAADPAVADPHQSAVDLLADLMHLWRCNGMDFERVIRGARRHARRETTKV